MSEGGVVYWLRGDHLGSTSLATNDIVVEVLVSDQPQYIPLPFILHDGPSDARVCPVDQSVPRFAP